MKAIGGNNTQLLGALILLLSVASFVEGHAAQGLIVESLFVLMIVTAMFDVRGGRRVLLVGAIVAAPAVISSLIGLLVEGSRVVDATSTATTLAFLLFAIFRLLGSVLRDRRVSHETIRGAICIYLLIGIAWAAAYSLAELAHPHSFTRPVVAAEDPVPGREEPSSAAPDRMEGPAHFFYFSFVTLSTLGYGDITPISPPARFLAWLEAVAGQLFIAVTIARLVALQTSQARSNGHES
jgi:hypothetical protein